MKQDPPQDIRERSFDFAARLVKFCPNLDASPGVSRTLFNQSLRSGTSIGVTIVKESGEA